MEYSIDVTDLYNKHAVIICKDGDQVEGVLLGVEKTYAIIKQEQGYIIVYDIKQIIVGG